MFQAFWFLVKILFWTPVCWLKNLCVQALWFLVKTLVIQLCFDPVVWVFWCLVDAVGWLFLKFSRSFLAVVAAMEASSDFDFHRPDDEIAASSPRVVCVRSKSICTGLFVEVDLDVFFDALQWLPVEVVPSQDEEHGRQESSQELKVSGDVTQAS